MPGKDLSFASELDMKLAYRESVAPGMVRLVIAIFCVLLALFTLLGPLDTRDSLAPIQRLAYFGMCGAMQVPICYAAAVLTLYLTRNLRPRQIALALTVTSLVVAAPCAAIAYTAYGLFRAGEPPGDRLSSIYLVCALDLWSATALGYYVLRLRLRRMIPRTSEDGTPPANESPDPVAGATTDARTRQSPTAANDIRQPPSTATAEISDEDDLPSRPAGPPAGRTSDHAKESPAVVPPERPPITDREPEAATGEVAPGFRQPGVSNRQSQFFRRLSAAVGRDIVYLKVSGHYVEVITRAGSDVILMRLADAVDALGGLGMQVHRSYWASYDHMNRLIRREGRMLLRLTDDREVPVSRPYLKAVRAVLSKEAARPPTQG